MNTDPYPWPCHRRDAHRPHQRPFNPDAPQGADGNGAGYGRCPGVPAHPATMAGGSYVLERRITRGTMPSARIAELIDRGVVQVKFLPSLEPPQAPVFPDLLHLADGTPRPNRTELP